MNHKRHYVFNIKAHIVFVVKYRKKILSKRFIDIIKDKAKELSAKYSFCVLEIGFGIDHIHVLVSYDPKFSISQIVRIIKQETTNAVGWLENANVFFSIYNRRTVLLVV